MEFLNMANSVPGGTLRLADDLVLSRMGFGAMQLSGPGVFGPPRDRDQALAVLREALGRNPVPDPFETTHDCPAGALFTDTL